MQKIITYITLFFIISPILVYGEQIKENIYEKSAISVKTPSQWKFSSDTNFMRHWELGFSTGEFSFVELQAFPKNKVSEKRYRDINLAGYFKHSFVPLITSSFSKDSYKMVSGSITRGKFVGLKAHIEYYVQNLDDIEAEVYLLTLDNAKIIVTIYTEKKDLPNVTYAIEDFLTSVKYVGNNKTTK